MKHNLILCKFSCCLSALMCLICLFDEMMSLTPATILLVATMYFAGRYMDKRHGN